MRILVASDVHDRPGRLAQVLEAQPSAHGLIFLGDGLRGVQPVLDACGLRAVYAVAGNCDFGATAPVTGLEILGSKRVFFTHGHKYNVKYGLYTLQLAAQERKADVVLFGHTHTPYEAYEEGMHFLNPGSLGYGGTYGYVDITPAGIMTGVARLP